MIIRFDHNNNSGEWHKCHFIGFVETFIGPSESLFFVYENEPIIAKTSKTHKTPTQKR